MSFKNDIKNYKSMQNTSFYYCDVPASLWSELPTFIAKSCDEETFSTVIQKISELTLITAPQFWSPEYSEEYIYIKSRKNTLVILTLFMIC